MMRVYVQGGIGGYEITNHNLTILWALYVNGLLMNHDLILKQ